MADCLKSDEGLSVDAWAPACCGGKGLGLRAAGEESAMANDGFALLERFNRTWRELDRVYHEVARGSGLSDCAFWTMYALAGSEDPLPQKAISQIWQYSKQTVASALQQLTGRGLVEVRLAEGSRRDKVIELTDAGQAFSERHVLPVARAEQTALAGLGAEGAEELLTRLGGYVRLLDEAAAESGLRGATRR